MDPHWYKLKSRAIGIPSLFSFCTGYNDYAVQKRKKPQISYEVLDEKVNILVNMVMMPWFLNSKFNDFRNQCEELTLALKKYLDFLKQQELRTASVHSSEAPVRSISDSWTTRTVQACESTRSEYEEVENALQELDEFQPIFLGDYQPVDRFERRLWLENLKLQFPIQLYSHHHGNFLGNFTFSWKIPVLEVEQTSTGNLNAIAKIRDDLPTFSSRAMRKAFFLRYAKCVTIKPAILRDIYRFLTEDSASAESNHQAEVDQRVALFLAESDDEDLIYDLRAKNGRPKDSKLDAFWDELATYLDEATVVHERRQGSVMYMPFALSMQHLLDTVSDRLPPDTPKPSPSWLRLNFWPTNGYTKSAMCYTGRFNVRYAVQRRLIRAKHPDSSFVYHQFSMLKEMAVKYRDISELICMDDKAIVPVGEPGHPVASGVRAHNRVLVPSAVTLAALDHDFHIHGAVPSVLLRVDIPSDYRDSFYRGDVHITTKDKLFQTSSAVRHCMETTSILRTGEVSTDGLSLTKPVLFVYTDGGPDHRSTFWSVQLAYIILFISLDLDMLVSARTAPQHSYSNPAERIMSLLNMGLQHASFERSTMSHLDEMKVKSQTTLKKLRALAERQPSLKESIQHSMEPVIAQLEQRFSQLRFLGQKLSVHSAASNEDIENLKQFIDIFKTTNEDSDVFTGVAEAKQIDNYPKLKEFIKAHCRSRQYTYQVKKCGSCWYCLLNPPRIPAEVIDELHWLPDPVLCDTIGKEEYKPFVDVYGTNTTDRDRPNLEGKVFPTEMDKRHKKTLVGGKVRAFIICAECGKRRVVYSDHKLGGAQCLALDRVQEELIYTCGSPLFPDDSDFHDKLIVREGLSCTCPMETTYYAGGSIKLQDVCFHCGDHEELVVDEEILELKKQYSIVRPICRSCKGIGKEPARRNGLKVGLKAKRRR